MVSKKKSKKKTSAKKVAKRKTTPARRKPAKRPAKKKAKKKISKAPTGYRKNPRGEVLIPDGDQIDTIVPPSKIKAGFEQAKREVRNLLDNMADFAEDYEVSEISLTVSFSADGKFLGFGVGGATSMNIKLTPGDHS